VLNVGIPTNGSLTTRVVKGARKVLESCPGMDFAIDVSIDAVGKDHDEIRRTPGLFEKATWTYRELQKLRKEFPRFNANVAITVQEKNHEKLDAIYAYFKEELKVSGITNLVVRGGKTLAEKRPDGEMYQKLDWGGPTGRPRDLSSRNFDAGNYVKFGEALKKDRVATSMAAYSGQPFGDLLSAMQNYRQDLISKILVEDKPQLPCYAGRLSGVIQNDGRVFPCELLDEPLGNLRDHGYDFRAIWHSQKTREVAQRIEDTRCHCTYECFMTNSILFTPKAYPRLAKELLDIKMGRFWNRITTGRSVDEIRQVPVA
jgi:radical SAM protein with 4Fe4S-binding SPASM domain